MDVQVIRNRTLIGHNEVRRSPPDTLKFYYIIPSGQAISLKVLLGPAGKVEDIYSDTTGQAAPLVRLFSGLTGTVEGWKLHLLVFFKYSLHSFHLLIVPDQ
ncbi:hypothetical protein XENORESO_020323 [Xenotaenia resolanae]|uniref:Uncharacterized protein n=1 Tax=Xenotaenia resolanae TaxID=208358 RepID=A0ABV0X3I1_9TELE